MTEFWIYYGIHIAFGFLVFLMLLANGSIYCRRDLWWLLILPLFWLPISLVMLPYGIVRGISESIAKVWRNK